LVGKEKKKKMTWRKKGVSRRGLEWGKKKAKAKKYRKNG